MQVLGLLASRDYDAIEIFVIFISMVRNVLSDCISRFTLELDPNHEVKHKITVVMKTENGMYMKATPRQRHR